jgi:hypothetical protein
MRPLLSLAWFIALFSPPFVVACGTDAGASPDAASDATTDAGSSLDAGTPADAQTCTSEAGQCLFGTAQPEGFVAKDLLARLYRTFPARGQEFASEFVARDQTWAFDSLMPWAHYYLQITPGFHADAGFYFDAGSTGAVMRVGPLAVPVADAGAVAVHVVPVELDVFEQGAAGSGAMQVLAASARLTEVSAGRAAVSIQIAGTSTSMPFDSTRSAYFVQFATPPAAQATYQITTSPMSGSTPSTWNLVAALPTFTAAITSPSAGATVPAGQADGGGELSVIWPLQPDADYVRVELYQGPPPGWRPVYSSPHPNAADVGQEKIPGNKVTTPGTYLLNVVFTKANCPPAADGCVHASAVATEQITVQ